MDTCLGRCSSCARRRSGVEGLTTLAVPLTDLTEGEGRFPGAPLLIPRLEVTPRLQVEDTSSRRSSRPFPNRSRQRRAREGPMNRPGKGRQKGGDHHLNPLLPGMARRPPRGRRSAWTPSQCCCRSRARPVAMATWW